ncbi:metallophosphoesterase [Halopelagius fulvigenes]|uniref:Metallophosphoesterase n=1 Tax=Halopelagius fulvigenes TaxID=1198324 RepID=A0ABD5U0C9_9EURY
MFEVVYRDRAAYLPGADALVLADVHVGRDEASSVEFPLGERRDLRERLADHLDARSPETVVFAGDVLHEFGSATSRAREGVADLTEACREAGARPVFVRGNHDTVLDSVFDGTVHDEYVLGGETDASVVVCHGHALPEREASLYVVGHDHPAITIEGTRRPCFLYGEEAFRGADVLMLPAFNRLAAGVVVNRLRTRDVQSPLVTDIDAFRPILYDESADEALTFPPLGEFRRML